MASGIWVIRYEIHGPNFIQVLAVDIPTPAYNGSKPKNNNMDLDLKKEPDYNQGLVLWPITFLLL